MLFDMSSWRFILIQLHLITRETQNKINTANKVSIMFMGYTFLLVAITPLISKQVVWVAMVDLAGAAIALGWNQLPPFLINAEIGEAMVDVLNVEKGVTRDSQEQVRESAICI